MTTQPKQLTLTDSFLEPYKNKEPEWGFNGLGGVVFKRTYAKHLESENRLEDWWETVRRVVEGCYNAQIEHCHKNMLPFNYNKGQISAQKMYDLIFNFKFLPPGRGLEHMGAKSLKEKSASILNNCSFISTKNISREFSYPFTFLMDMSMLGVGVGGDTLGAETVVIKEPRISEAPYVVPDSREGWVESVEVLLEAFVGRGKLPCEYDYSKVRPKGAKLKTLGGIASGPQPLIDLHNSLIELLNSRVGEAITSTDIVDIFNYIGKCVVSGGQRRCLSKDTVVNTKEGVKRIEDVEVGDEVLTPQGWMPVTNKFDQGIQQTIRINHEWDGYIECTMNHRIARFLKSQRTGIAVTDEDYEFVHAIDLKKGDELLHTCDSLDIAFCGARVVSIETGPLIQTYDIEVSGPECFVAEGVLVHNSAELLLGLPDDEEFVKLKDPEINKEALMSHRWCSNNSITAQQGMDYTPFIDSIAKNGEPGFFWLDNARHYGRMKDGYGDWDVHVDGCNPCQPAHATVLTPEGIKTFADIDVGSVIWSGSEWTTVTKKWSTGVKPVYEYITEQHQENGIPAIFIGTRNHRVVQNGEKIEAKDATHIDSGWHLEGYGRPSFGIIEVESIGEMEVFDITVDCDDHTYWTGGLLVSNCGEQSLEGEGELCCLVETFPANHDSLEEFNTTLKYAYLYAKTVTLIPTHNPRVNAIIGRNRRIGTSVSGIAQAIEKFGFRNFIEALDHGHTYLRGMDKMYSRWLCVPTSIKITSVKPSGCRPWDAIAVTSKGILTMEELFEMSGHIEGEDWHDFENEIYAGEHRITKSFDNGTESLWSVQLSYNLVLESTADHKWFVKQHYDRSKLEKYIDINEWKRTDEIEPGDILEVDLSAYSNSESALFKRVDKRSISMRNDANPLTQPSRMNPDIAWLLGYLWGDGAMSPKLYRIRFVDEHGQHLEKAQKILRDNFGLNCNLHRASEHRNALTLEIGSKHFWHWLIRNGVWKYWNEGLNVIPKVVRSSSREDVIAFIAGMLDADGCVSKLAHYEEDTYKAIWTTADPFFANHLQHVMWSVGLVVGRSENQPSASRLGTRPVYLMALGSGTLSESLALLRKHSVKCQKTQDSKWQCEVASHGLVIGKVLSVEDTEVPTPTFDIEVENSHEYMAGAVRSHNSVSILSNSTPGIHYPHSEYYIRRVRFNNASPIPKELERCGYPVEESAYGDETLVVSFPVKEKYFSRSKTDVSLWEQLELAAQIQEHWSDNQVSITVSFKKEEVKDLAHALERYESRLKSVSFLPLSDHGYAQAPYEEITKEQYEEMVVKLKPIDYRKLNKHEVSEKFCDGDSCALPEGFFENAEEEEAAAACE